MVVIGLPLSPMHALPFDRHTERPRLGVDWVQKTVLVESGARACSARVPPPSLPPTHAK